MSISLLLEMASSANPDRTALVAGETRLTTEELSNLADGGAGVLQDVHRAGEPSAGAAAGPREGGAE